MLKGAIAYDRIKSMDNPSVRKVASRVTFFDVYGYEAACRHLAELRRFALVAARLKMACAAAEFGEALLYMPDFRQSNTFYQDYVAIPFPKRSNLTKPIDKVYVNIYLF